MTRYLTPFDDGAMTFPEGAAPRGQSRTRGGPGGQGFTCEGL